LFLQREHPDFWRTLVVSELHFDEENRDMWFHVGRYLKPAGFDYQPNAEMITFVFDIRMYIVEEILPRMQSN